MRKTIATVGKTYSDIIGASAPQKHEVAGTVTPHDVARRLIGKVAPGSDVESENESD